MDSKDTSVASKRATTFCISRLLNSKSGGGDKAQAERARSVLPTVTSGSTRVVKTVTLCQLRADPMRHWTSVDLAWSVTRLFEGLRSQTLSFDLDF